MIKILRERSDFIKNSFKLVAGTAIAQAISFLISPVITRLYTPADFGIFTFIISVVGGFGLIATLRYEMAIVLPREEKHAVNLVFISLGIAFLLCLGIAAGVFIFNAWFHKPGMIDPAYKSWLYVIPVMVLLVAAGNVFQNWFNRQKEYKTLALAKVLTSAGNNLVTLGLGFMGIGVWGLLAGNFSGLLMFNLLFVLVIIRRYHGHFGHYDRSGHKALALQYKDLPLANTPQMLIELVQLYGIVFLLQAFFSSEVLGWYSLSQRLLQAPMWLIGTSLCQVYYKEASERFAAEGNITGLLGKTIKMSVMVAFPVLVVMLTAGPWLIGFIFGSAWRESGEIARILAPWFFFDFIRYSISQTPLIIGKARQMFFVSMIGAAFMIIAVSLGGVVLKNSTSSFILLSSLLSCYSIGVIWWILSSVKKASHVQSVSK
ncbi:MAG: lipopolysaccharide biosynthesis protein [Bacteroidales bacterium]